jgi:hypothetical protein
MLYRSVADILELRKLKRVRQGIESSKLIVGDAKKRRKQPDDLALQEPAGLRPGARTPLPEGDDAESAFFFIYHSGGKLTTRQSGR